MLTENFFASITGEPFSPDVPRHDEAFAIKHENGVVLYPLDQQSKSLFTLLEGLLLDPFPEPVQIDEDRDLVLQNFRHDRFDQVIHRAAREPANDVGVQGVDAREENNWRIAGPPSLPNQRGRLIAVQLRHTDVQQDHGEVFTQQVPLGILARFCFHDDAVWSRKQRLHRREQDGIIVDDQYMCWDRQICIRGLLRQMPLDRFE